MSPAFQLLKNVASFHGFTTCRHEHVGLLSDYRQFCEDCGTTLDDSWSTTKEAGTNYKANGKSVVRRDKK